MWTVAVIAEAFHVLPSVVARDLDEDPEQLSRECFRLLVYQQAKRAFDAADDKKALEPWRGNPMMEAVTQNTFDLHKERLARG